MITAISRPQMSGSLPPVAPHLRQPTERFFLGRLDDAWFLIPLRCRLAWTTLLASPPSHHVAPNYARRINNPFALTFVDPKET